MTAHSIWDVSQGFQAPVPCSKPRKTKEPRLKRTRLLTLPIINLSLPTIISMSQAMHQPCAASINDLAVTISHSAISQRKNNKTMESYVQYGITLKFNISIFGLAFLFLRSSFFFHQIFFHLLASLPPSTLAFFFSERNPAYATAPKHTGAKFSVNQFHCQNNLSAN